MKSGWSIGLVACALVPGLLVSSMCTHALEVSGVQVEERVRAANTDLQLNGAGIRYAAAGLVRVYVAALYLPQKRSTAQDIAALKGPKRIHLHLLREVNANDLSKGLMTGMKNNLSIAEQQKHFDSMLRLGSIFGQIPSLKRGETISVDQIPGTGTVIMINGRRVGEPFPDENFWHALLQIWVGPKPIEESLKPVLLGTAASNDHSSRGNEPRF